MKNRLFITTLCIFASILLGCTTTTVKEEAKGVEEAMTEHPFLYYVWQFEQAIENKEPNVEELLEQALTEVQLAMDEFEVLEVTYDEVEQMREWYLEALFLYEDALTTIYIEDGEVDQGLLSAYDEQTIEADKKILQVYTELISLTEELPEGLEEMLDIQ
ncbi:hypothetical protein [Halalkalibacter krulwichiae]|uniref:Lipoprotein n=1 Tax=Halalkalibacter krulwichiae TaxID=199441 RepID=A0A1X9MEX3_9BACI|nr:hypothetical protein [Halalkalibacter krulwichiae]ARK31988.1 hypothetical protein BkAM31D_20255 [Halalkalibacter krulwichiae]